MSHVDLAAVRAAFDDQMRRHVVAPPEATVERSARLTRTVADDGSWSAVLWSDLSAADADEVVAAEFARDGTYLEWKHYTGDRPTDLPERLEAAGWVPKPAEAILIADLHAVDLPLEEPPGVRLVPVEDERGITAMTGVHRQVFGDVHPGTAAAVRTALLHTPRPVEAVLACAGEVAVSAGRIEYSEGTEFASLWGGGTLPEWRGRGAFRALVAWRAARARERGFRYLQVDAMPMSRPILERLGFVQIAETTPWVRER